MRHAIELDPNNPFARTYLGILLTQKGRSDEGVRVMHDLVLANPVAIDCGNCYAVTLLEARRYDEAIAQCERLIKLDPNLNLAYLTYAEALTQKGRFQDAEAAFAHGRPIPPDLHAWLLALQGKADAARQVLKGNPSLVTPRTAVAHYLLGEHERGLAELDYLANEKWSTKTLFLRVDPTFDPMRNDPRFAEIVKKIGLLDN